MAVKIIAHGRTAEKERSIACQHCGCVFSFCPSDAKLVQDFRDGDYYEIKCPDGCGHLVTASVAMYY